MKKIRLSKASISPKEIAAVTGILKDEFLGMGAEVIKFEQLLEAYFGNGSHVVCVNSGTAALHLALEALGIEPGDEVLVPSITYVASYQAISASGAIPISCDVDPQTLFLDANDARLRITSKTKAIMPVFHSSSGKGISEVYALAKEHDLRVVEDAAQAFGSYLNNGLVGASGDITCLSFDGIKNITCGEGGAVVTRDSTLAERIRDTRLLGVEKDTVNRSMGLRSWEFDVKHQGYRYHMSNINAAIGIAQLSRLNEFREKRQNIVRLYLANLVDVPQINFFDLDYECILPHIFAIKVEQRDTLRKFLEDHNIETGIHYKPNHLLSKYCSSYSLSNAEAVYKKIITLPCHFDLKSSEVMHVCTLIKSYFYG